MYFSPWAPLTRHGLVFSVLCHMSTQQEGSHLHTRKPALTRQQLCPGLDLGIPSHLVHANLAWQPELTKMTLLPH